MKISIQQTKKILIIATNRRVQFDEIEKPYIVEITKEYELFQQILLIISE